MHGKGDSMRFEKLDFFQQINVLKRMHRLLNKHKFDGKLSEVSIDICNIEKTGDYYAMYIRACPKFGRFKNGIAFSYSFEEDIEKEKTIRDQVYMIGLIMLHEMIHQYCHENGIDDSGHNQNFMDAAKEHGLHSIYKDGNFVEEDSWSVWIWTENFRIK